MENYNGLFELHPSLNVLIVVSALVVALIFFFAQSLGRKWEATRRQREMEEEAELNLSKERFVKRFCEEIYVHGGLPILYGQIHSTSYATPTEPVSDAAPFEEWVREEGLVSTELHNVQSAMSDYFHNEFHRQYAATEVNVYEFFGYINQEHLIKFGFRVANSSVFTYPSNEEVRLLLFAITVSRSPFLDPMHAEDRANLNFA